jgi:uncharacterized protein YggU (UPF0235/DUF167 family)
VSDGVDGVIDGVLRVRVAAPPVEGAANHALVRVIAEELGVARRSVRIVAGAAGRQKLVVVDDTIRTAPAAGPSGPVSVLGASWAPFD